MDRSAQALAIGVLEEADEDRGSEKQRQGRVPHKAPIGHAGLPA